jgi:hypothetical protein
MRKTLLFIIALIGAIGLRAQTMYVDLDAAGNNDGTSWTNAFTNLDTAFAEHDIAFWGQEIWIAEGTYTPGDGLDRNASFSLAQASIFGGFDGTETSRGERDYKNNLTILSGDLQGNDNGNISWAETTRSDNSYSVIYNQSGNRLDGFTIEGGHANDNASSDWKQAGAAIYNFNNGLDIANCIFKNNAGYEDAVIRFRAPTGYNTVQDIFNCEFYNNQGFGSLIGATRPNTFFREHSMRLFNNLFHNNELVSNDGSIIYANSFEDAGSFNSGSFAFFIYNNTFVNNKIPTNGGTIGFGTAHNNQAFNMTSNLYLEVIGNIFWDKNESPLVRKSRMFSGVLVNSEWFIFGANLVKQTTTILDTDLFANIAFSYANVYNDYPMFTDTANLDFTITACSSPANDLANYDVSNQEIPDALFTLDFYGNERLKGLSYDAGHCEIQDEAAALAVQQLGATLEATAGFSDYTWYFFGDPNNPILLNETTNILTPTYGDGSYILTVEDADMCNNLAEFNFCTSVTVSIDLVGDSLVATASGGNIFVWYLDGSVVASGEIDTYTPTSPGIYAVSHSFFDGVQTVGCSGSASYEITCDAIPDAVITNNNGTLEVNADYDDYQWSQGGANLNGETSPTFTPVSDGDYQVSVTGAFACTQNSAVFSFCSSVNVSISLNDTVLDATPGFTSYEWYLVGGSIAGIPGANTATYNPTQDGDYYVNASDGNCNGTSNTISFSLGNPNTSIQSSAFSTLKVYPNPTKDIISITAGNEVIKYVKVLDLSGSLLMELGNELQISLADLKSGMYILEISNVSQTSMVKIIKK